MCSECGYVAYRRLDTKEEYIKRNYHGTSIDEYVCFNPDCTLCGRPYTYYCTKEMVGSPDIHYPTPEDPIKYRYNDPDIWLQGEYPILTKNIYRYRISKPPLPNKEAV